MGEEKKNGSLVRNAADKKQVENAGKTEKRKREQELNDIASILSTRGGRRHMYRMVNEVCHYDADDFNHSGSITNYSLGERAVGKVVKVDCIEADFEMWHLAEKENWSFLQPKGD